MIESRSSAKLKRPSAPEADGAISFARAFSRGRRGASPARGKGAQAPREAKGRKPRERQKGRKPRERKVQASDADGQSTHSQAAGDAARQEEGPGLAAEPAEARRLHARLYDDSEEAEFGVAQGRQGPFDQRL